MGHKFRDHDLRVHHVRRDHHALRGRRGRHGRHHHLYAYHDRVHHGRHRHHLYACHHRDHGLHDHHDHDLRDHRGLLLRIQLDLY